MGGSSTWLIRHSSDVLIMFIRDYGAYLRLNALFCNQYQSLVFLLM